MSNEQNALMCRRWLENPAINPRTGRRITLNGPTYRQLQAECAMYNLSREDVLASLRNDCFNDDDPIYLSSFEDMQINDLGRIVKIGRGSKKHCFPLESIVELIKTAIENGRRPLNPYTREPISYEDIARVVNLSGKNIYNIPDRTMLRTALGVRNEALARDFLGV
jgi:hypothetical protein